MANVNGFSPSGFAERLSVSQAMRNERRFVYVRGAICLEDVAYGGLSCDVAMSVAIARYNGDIVCIHAFKEEHYAHHHS